MYVCMYVCTDGFLCYLYLYRYEIAEWQTVIKTFPSWILLIPSRQQVDSNAAQQLPEPKFSLTYVYRVHACQTCFAGDVRKNRKRQHFETISDVEYFMKVARQWQEVDHIYKNVHHTVEWSDKNIKYAHKTCKSSLFNKRLKKKI